MEAFSPRLRFAINQGVGWLNYYFDGDTRKWLSRIVKKDLDLGDPYKCVIGQVFEPERDDFDLRYSRPGYSVGLEELQGYDDDMCPHEYGFDAGSRGVEGYEELTAAWLVKIAELEAALDTEEED